MTTTEALRAMGEPEAALRAHDHAIGCPNDGGEAAAPRNLEAARGETINERVKSAPANAVLADVRTPEEYAQGHIPGSVNWPLERLATLDIFEDAPILTYCHSGSRSARAAAKLRQMGLDAESVGGILDWTGEIE